MKKNLIIVVVVLFISLGRALSFAKEDKTSPLIKTIELNQCKDPLLGIRFLCNPDWELETHDNAILIIISSDPAVTLTISKAKSPVIFFEQLTDSALKEMGQYADGFTKEKIKIANEDAVKVSGYSRDFPELRLLDFYFIRDFELYSILFSINPKEEFSNFEPLFDKIIKSVDFLEKGAI